MTNRRTPKLSADEAQTLIDQVDGEDRQRAYAAIADGVRTAKTSGSTPGLLSKR